MCGFAVFIGPSARLESQGVRRAAARIRHRGPDDSGLRETERAVLAHQRLSIIDVAGGRQPLGNEDERALLVCNGEIYNQAQLRQSLKARHRFRTQSDSEVILHLYEDLGPACVPELEGMFAFVVAEGDRFLAARDALGIKPLYYSGDPERGIWFASELKALPAGLSEVAELPPGCLLTESGQVERWFQPPWAQRSNPVDPDPAQLAARLEAAVRRRLMSDVPVGVFLSGGLDSSVVAALMRKHVEELHSFSVGLAGSPDLLFARQVAAHLGTIHHERVYTEAESAAAVPKVIEHLESYDPALIRSAVPCYFLAELAAQHVKVVLTGEGADEAFAGYRHFKRSRSAEQLHQECERLLLGLHNMNLQRVDRMTMAHALEGRVPFLDLAFLEWAMGLDPRHKLQGPDRPEKWLLRSAFSSLLPAEIVWRGKQEFADGAGSDTVLRQQGERAVSAEDFARAPLDFPIDTPRSKEELLYRRTFESLFPGEGARNTVGRWLGSPAAFDA